VCMWEARVPGASVSPRVQGEEQEGRVKFRKKPVVIEAVRWTGVNVEEALAFIADENGSFAHLPSNGGDIDRSVGHIPALGLLESPTLEGVMQATPGDWLIKGVAGEFYPCKPDIFEQTYEPVEEAVK